MKYIHNRVEGTWVELVTNKHPEGPFLYKVLVRGCGLPWFGDLSPGQEFLSARCPDAFDSCYYELPEDLKLILTGKMEVTL